MNTNNALKDLRKSIAQLDTSLSDVKTDLEQSLSDPLCSVPPVTTTCNEIRMALNQLDNNTNLGKVRRGALLREDGGWVLSGQLGSPIGHRGPGLRPPSSLSYRGRREGIMRNPFSRVLCDRLGKTYQNKFTF